MPKPILFLAHNYPPKVGGLEEYGFRLMRGFVACMNVFETEPVRPISMILDRRGKRHGEAK